MNPVRRNLGPRTQFPCAHASLDGTSGVGTINGRYGKDDKPSLGLRTEAKLSHVVNKALDPGLHQPTGAL